MAPTIRRRQVLAGGGVLALGGALAGCAGSLLAPQSPAARLELAPLRARADRITRITVCTRPFRPKGPRIETERVGDKLVVHNYGHGGSGWSLSWGSASMAAELALATGQNEIGVVGCGAIGLTTATVLQRAGARVTIYARDLPPNVRSSLATGVWTPDSRICFDEFATLEFKQRWERMVRTSFDAFQTMLGLPGDPIQFFDSYFVADEPRVSSRRLPESDPRPRFAELQRELVPDLLPAADTFAPGTHSLGARRLRRAPTLMFNLTAYAHLLIGDFIANGGRIEVTEFRTPADLARIREKTLVHATGYGARQLFGDTSVIPVRGQLARTPPEDGIGYGLVYRNAAFVPRRDGFVFQIIGDDDYYGFDDTATAPDRAEAELAVNTIVGLFAPA